MARFDVFIVENTEQRVVDVQADILRDLRTRIVVPLVPAEFQPMEQTRRLRPELMLDGAVFVLNTPELAALSVARLVGPIASLIDQRDTIVDAVDFVMQGF